MTLTSDLVVEVAVKKVGAFNPLAVAVRISGRPWWQCRYRDGKQLSEWETPKGIITRVSHPDPRRWRESRWEEVAKRGMVGLRLLCPTPDGIYAELRVNRDEGHFIQFKRGGRSFAIGMGGQTKQHGPEFTDAHVIGAVNYDGQVRCFAWERMPHAFIPHPDATFIRCVTCGLAQNECGGRDVKATVVERLREWVPDPKWPQRVNRERTSSVELAGEFHQLIQWTDSIHGMRYRNIGPLSVAVQQVKV